MLPAAVRAAGSIGTSQIFTRADTISHLKRKRWWDGAAGMGGMEGVS